MHKAHTRGPVSLLYRLQPKSQTALSYTTDVENVLILSLQCFYSKIYILTTIVSERELMFTFAICYRLSVCLSVVCLSYVTFVRPTQAVQILAI